MNIKNLGILQNIKHEFVGYLLENTKKLYWENCQKYVYERGIDPKKICEVDEILNIPYINHCEVALAMDIFKPILPEDEEMPVVVCIHGGALVVEDRTYFRNYAHLLAGRGYLVFSLDYRLAPFFNSAEQLDDICAGMDEVGKQLVNYNVDFKRMYMAADSAGAFLAIYTAAMKKSEKLQNAIGYKPTRMVFRALALHSGMFYTTLSDPIGFVLSDQLHGSKIVDESFLKYMNPENPEIIRNLPPVFLTTSRGDFLNNYTLMYHQALKKAGMKSHLLYYGEKDLWHAFPTFDPYNEHSLDVIDRMLAWFEEQTAAAEKEKVAEKEEAVTKEEVAEREEAVEKENAVEKGEAAEKEKAAEKEEAVEKEEAAEKEEAVSKEEAAEKEETENIDC